MQEMRYSEAGFSLTKRFEGCRLKAYRDSVGVLTIGYGHTGPDVTEGLEITQEVADDVLILDVARCERFLHAHVTAEITQGMFDALVDFAFNLGEHALGGSTLLKKVNLGDFAGAAAEFEKWDHAGGKVVPGLLKRRKAEEALFRGEA